ncbi:MAG: undecaprenyl-phosphate glucose phosphotransferase [Ignavibacteria bacterium]|nr:undecaprenyl-phosphate glucose phosphotransferase [Ignavibacteria bacterium]
MGDPPAPSARTSRAGDFLITLVTICIDILAIEAAFLISYWLRFDTLLFDQFGWTEADAPPLRSYFLGSLVVIPVWLMLFQSRRMYSPRRSVSLADELFAITRIVSLGMLMIACAAFLYRDFSFSRIVFFILWGNAIVLVFTGRAVVLWLERKAYRRGRHLRHAIILGNDTHAEDILRKLQRHPSFGFLILGYFAESPAPGLAEASYLGTIHAAPAYIREHGVDLAFISLRSEDHPMLFDFISECEGLNIDFMMVPDLLEVLATQMHLTELEGIPLLRIKSVPFSLWGRVIKRSFDLLVSVVLIAILSPLLVLVAILIKLDSRGPVFFKQERIGLDGHSFTMYKFRSMRSGAEQQVREVVLGIRNDPRRTRVGVWLRKTSVDEIPQLLNVVRGEMSLVGPRPERTIYVDQFRKVIPKYIDRHRVKTGITGWAQVNGYRGDTSIEDRIRYDLYYIENWSFSFDIKILLRTIRAAIDFKNVD